MPATAAQITANRENAAHSTGPRTPEGKSKSARNATKLGLFTAEAFVLPEEQEQYEALSQAFWLELRPEGALEQTHALEMIRASWRLQRCAKIEAALADALIDGTIDESELDRKQLAVDRARAQSNNTLRRSTTELRRIQTNREIEYGTEDAPGNFGIADRKVVTAALHANFKAEQTARKLQGIDSLVGLLEYTDKQMTQSVLAGPQFKPAGMGSTT